MKTQNNKKMPAYKITDFSEPSVQRVQSALEYFRDGKMVVVVDDEARENEGDLIVAAEYATNEAINFMATYGRGLICVALTKERLTQLNISRMVSNRSSDSFNTAFMESVDARKDVTTGISAHDRAATVKQLVSETARADDFVSPGHIFPLEAKPGGVLKRAGHTESAVDLARISGLKPAAVICEIMRDDGKMARLPDLLAFSEKYELPILTVADLIAYRRKTDKLVEYIRSVNLPTEFGQFTLKLYHSLVDDKYHVALVMGEPSAQPNALVRIHSECLTGDVFGSLRCDCGPQLHKSLSMVHQAGCGVVLYMRQEGRGIGLPSKIHAYQLQEEGLDTVEANERLGFPPDLRDYGIGAQILNDLGLKKIRLITNNPQKIIGLKAYGIEIVGREPIITKSTKYNERYLNTKKQKMGHWL
jgi:3,4-dihydroxy 2-butanone 4-phosphate synthase / GTP cyclohydrolase II